MHSKELVPEIVIPDIILSELALDGAGITQDQRHFMMTQAENDKKEGELLFDRYKRVLFFLFPDVTRFKTAVGAKAAGKGKFGKGKGTLCKELSLPLFSAP